MMQRLLSDLPSRLPQELTEVLVADGAIRIERIVSTGHSSPPGFWYDQSEHEWVVVLKGSGVVSFETGKTFRLEAGDSLLINAHCRHRVEATSLDEPTVWLAVFWSS